MQVPRRTHGTGFTLVELLVVFACIAILSAIVLPVLAQAAEKARQAMCLSNVRQLGLACHMYCEDSGGSYPLVNYNYFARQPQLLRSLDPYLRNRRVWSCPNAASRQAGWDADRAWAAGRPGYYVWMFDHWELPAPDPERTDNWLIPPLHDGADLTVYRWWGYTTSPGERDIILTDRFFASQDFDCARPGPSLVQQRHMDPAMVPIARIQKGTSALWMDGHARMIHPYTYPTPPCP